MEGSYEAPVKPTKDEKLEIKKKQSVDSFYAGDDSDH